MRELLGRREHSGGGLHGQGGTGLGWWLDAGAANVEAEVGCASECDRLVIRKGQEQGENAWDESMAKASTCEGRGAIFEGWTFTFNLGYCLLVQA